MNTESIHHLGIEDLVAKTGGALLGEEATLHLATCSDCHREAERWNAVAVGVRHLVSAVAPPAMALVDRGLASTPDLGRPADAQPVVRPVARHPRRRVLVPAVAAALLVIAGSVGLTVRVGGGGSPGSSHPIAQGHQGGAPAWRLVSDVSTSWQIAPSAGYEPGAFLPFACPTSTTCYAETLNPVPRGSGGEPTENQIEVTRDGGSSWQQATLPVTLSDPGALSCPASTTCALLGIEASGQPTFLETTDGGKTWNVHAGPTGLTSANGTTGMVCTTTTTCLAVPGDPVGDSTGAVAFITHDGGATWTTSAMPAGFSQGPNSLQCPSASSCVVGGAFQAPDGATGAGIAYSTDGGASWAAATVPAGFGGAASLSCGGPSDCVAVSDGPGSPTQVVVTSNDGGETWTEVAASGLPGGGRITGLSCVDSICWAAGVTITGGNPATITGGMLASSSDGGQHFEEAAMPTGVGPLLSISCPSATRCYALAQQENGQGIDLLAYGAAGSTGS